jgi:glutamate racemase
LRVARNSSPIAVLDSGLGGLTVVRALQRVLPCEDIVYFGDTARLPYGSKTAPTIITFVRQIIDYLRPLDPKHVVIACNTATALALPIVRSVFPDLSITGVVDPGAKAAVIAAGAKRVPVIGVLATEATVRSKAYERAIHRLRAHARLVLRPASLLVPIIEEGRDCNDPLVTIALKQYLRPLIQHGVDVLVLGCTHYPILKEAICAIVGPSVRVIDSAEQCADDVARRLRARSLLNCGERASDAHPWDELEQLKGGSLRCFVTDGAPRFARLASRFLGVEIDPPTCVSPDELIPSPGPSVNLAVRRPA